MEEPITHEYRETIRASAEALDEALNGCQQGADRKHGFILMVFPFGDGEGEDHRADYISNGNRADVICVLKEVTARLQGQPEMHGHG